MIRVEDLGAVARITLDAPERHNALTRAAIAELHAAIDALGPAVRALILTGAGRSFCAGADLREVGGDWAENPLTALADRLEEVSVPTLCALNGGVYGGGVELALACDFRIGAAGMRAEVPAARLGIHYPPEGLARAEALLGLQLTRRLFLAAERLEADTLLAAGFVDALHAPDALAGAAEARARALAALAPLAVQGMKASLRAQGRGAPDPGAAERIRACFASADHLEALAARRERRTPHFRGR